MIKILGILLISFVTMLGLTAIDGQGFAWFVCGFSSLATLLLILHIGILLVQFNEEVRTKHEPMIAELMKGFRANAQSDSSHEPPHEGRRYKRGKYRKRPATEMEVRKGGAYNADSIATEIE